MVDLYGVWYLVLVVHSDGHEERRTKRFKRILEQDRAKIEYKAQSEAKMEYACLADA